MKAKFFVITILVLFLGIIVYEMMRFETNIRQERIIHVKIQDDTKPLLTELPTDQLSEISKKADYYFIAKGNYFHSLHSRIENGEQTKNWEQIFLKGVNLGLAMPGHYPTEFSLNFDGYLEWFRLIGEMNANVIRTYTILPPEFYEAFAYYNLHYNNKKLYLLQGVWAEEPQTDNYFYPKFDREFKSEIIDLIDVIHGRAVIEPRPGHASGTYGSDISKYVAGIILGREWEPKAVIHTNKINNVHQFNGNFISINNGNAMEVWLAKVMDFTVMYETQTYAAQHPISFVNWLPLDPMYHSTEFIESKKVREYDNDLEQLDFRKYNATQLFSPGIFASYHAYPYYPDFIYLQKNYTASLNSFGVKDSYYGYLDDLKKHVPDMPLIIAEYGLPSSRGNSHYTPSGFNQGGLSEQQQADLSKTLTEDIHHTKCGGAIFFEWIDEWFKFNWLVMDFEQPYERRNLWHNMENPEQNFGIMAIESGGKIIDGDLSDWKKQPSSKDETEINFDADASYFYISAQLPDFDIKKHKLYFAIDTYDKEKGNHRLPFLQKTLDRGIEFLVSLDNPENSKIMVDAPYSVYTDIYKDLIPVYASQKNSNSNFIEQILLTNRERISLMGDTIKQITHNRSKLQFGKSNLPEHSNVDWFWNEQTKILEIRLDWHLLNVCDPSGRHVLDDKKGTPDIEYSKTEGFYIYPFVADKKDVHITKSLVEKEYFFKWDTWDNSPLYKKRLKPIYTTFKNLFPTLAPINKTIKIENEQFTIAPFYGNKPGAISILFDDSDYSQYETALPVLNKYKIKATFGAVNEWINNSSSTVIENNGLKIKKMGLVQLTELLQDNHEIALQLAAQENNKMLPAINQAIDLKDQKKGLESKLGATVSTIYYTNYQKKNDWIATIKKNDFLFGCNINTSINASTRSRYELTPLTTLANPLQSLDSLLLSGNKTWQIFQYPHSSETNYKRGIIEKKLGYQLTTAEVFERQIRLIRNSSNWIAPIAVVGKYIEERNVSQIKFTARNNIIFLTVVNTLPNEFNQPLTIIYTTKHRKIKISNSPADGIYEARDGVIYFQITPNKEINIEIIEL